MKVQVPFKHGPGDEVELPMVSRTGQVIGLHVDRTGRLRYEVRYLTYDGDLASEWFEEIDLAEAVPEAGAAPTADPLHRALYDALLAAKPVLEAFDDQGGVPDEESEMKPVLDQIADAIARFEQATVDAAAEAAEASAEPATPDLSAEAPVRRSPGEGGSAKVDPVPAQATA